MRRHLTYANVMATIAVILALGGGTAYAATMITSKQIKNGTIRTADLAASTRKALRGQVGAAGAAGSKGDAGTAGAAGPRGDAGAAGPAGVKGDAGGQGAVGPVGPVGAQGSAGAPGATGSAGTTGTRGPTGPAGAQGFVGYQVLVQSTSVATGATGAGVLFCPKGKVALGGGVTIAGGSAGTSFVQRSALNKAFYDAGGNPTGSSVLSDGDIASAYEFQLVNQSGGTRSVNAQLTCVTGG